ncbi:MAG TPA: 30S ribosomal protein S21 [Candidatus Cloacimonadota bacterium]|nr:30S ribosomal protein S21 [Candidatus Cloacimonadota bacterium]
MPTVIAKETEPFEITLKRFKKKCEKVAILSEIKKHQAFEKPSVARKRKENVARRKMVKLTRKMERYS